MSRSWVWQADIAAGAERLLLSQVGEAVTVTRVEVHIPSGGNRALQIYPIVAAAGVGPAGTIAERPQGARWMLEGDRYVSIDSGRINCSVDMDAAAGEWIGILAINTDAVGTHSVTVIMEAR